MVHCLLASTLRMSVLCVMKQVLAPVPPCVLFDISVHRWRQYRRLQVCCTVWLVATDSTAGAGLLKGRGGLLKGGVTYPLPITGDGRGETTVWNAYLAQLIIVCFVDATRAVTTGRWTGATR